jgi:uncharacterized MAPEG superfamily protein
MSVLTCLELAVLLWLAHLLCQAGTSGAPLPYRVSSRDDPAPEPTVIGGRAARAFRNYLESFPAFVALDLAFLATNHPAGIWPTLWICARIVYLPVYLAGVRYVRSLVWGISLLALVAMLVRLAL